MYGKRFLLFTNGQVWDNRGVGDIAWQWIETEREGKRKCERCEIKNKLTIQKKWQKEREREREREKWISSSSQRIDEKNYWFDRKRKWVRADVEWIEEKDKSSLIERRRHAVKEKLTRFVLFSRFSFFLSLSNKKISRFILTKRTKNK